MSDALRALHLLLVLGLGALHAFGGYALCLIVVGRALYALRPRQGRARPERAGEPPRIAALVVAHDEERVVAHSVESLVAQDYPRDRFEVFVVADHCTDSTAQVASDAGATVLSRMGSQAEGKPAAVSHGVHVAVSSGRFDAVVVFDADNRVDSRFLGRVAERLARGDTIVQGLVDAKNAAASWVSGSSALGFWAIATVAQAPRDALGLSVPLMGTGFAMSIGTAQALLDRGETLTDDLELGARIVLSGQRACFAPDAVTFDEKPSDLVVAAAQRKRWMQGRWAVAERYVPKLLRSALTAGPLAARLCKVDVAIQLLSPSLLFIGVATLIAATLSCLVERGLGGEASPFTRASLVLGLAYYLVPAFFIRRFHPAPKVWACYFLQPLYLALSAPLAITGFLYRRRPGWWRTPKGG